MTLWHRAPRAVYRVYGEDEYLAEDEPHLGDAPPAPPPEQRAHGSRPGRLVGLGVLIGVTVGVLAVVVLNVSHRPLAPGSVVAQGARTDTASRPSAANTSAAHTSAASRSATASYAPVRAPTGAAPAVHTSTVSLRHIHARALVRLPSRVGKSAESVPSPVPVQPWRRQLAIHESDGSPPAEPPIHGEFEFEVTR